MDIALFRILHDIAVENGVSQEQWGIASGNVPQPRISELLRLSKGKSAHTSRYFTLTRYLDLYRGLKSILGAGIVKKAIINKADQESDPKVRLWAKLATLVEAEEEEDRQKVAELERFVDLLNK